MKRIHLLSTAALGLALLAAPALAQRQGMGGDASLPAPTPQNGSAAEADRMHKGNGTSGGPVELLRQAQSAMRGGQARQANELLERAETRLLAGVEPTKPAGGEPAFHVSEARRALTSRDRAEAMRHTNMAIATLREGAATGSDAGGERLGAQSGGPGHVASGMNASPGGAGTRAVVRDSGTGGATASRAEGVVLAQSGAGTDGSRAGTGRPSAPTGLPPGDTIPGWSGSRGGAAGSANTAPQGTTGPLGQPPTLTAPPVGTPSAGAPTFGSQGLPAGPSSSSLTGGEAARVGGAPPSDTSRAPGSSGISGAGVGGTLR